eukprot:4229752-Prorocentrum_lima.AAC.1
MTGRVVPSLQIRATCLGLPVGWAPNRRGSKPISRCGWRSTPGKRATGSPGNPPTDGSGRPT